LRADLTVLPDGTGLPPGQGTARQGATLYAQQCAACHGDKGEGRGDFPALAGGRGSLAGDKPVLTVGSYWPYATTLWDYINRAMPYTDAGTLSADGVYAVTAYVLYLNAIVSERKVLDRETLPRIRMPNRDGFIDGSRRDVSPNPSAASAKPVTP
jgi:cytochrome c